MMYAMNFYTAAWVASEKLAFKNWQLEAIKTVHKGKNALIIQPTGG